MRDKLLVAKKKFNSRLIVGTGKYRNMSECAKAINFSGADIVLYLPVPTISLELNFFLATTNLSFNGYPPPMK